MFKWFSFLLILISVRANAQFEPQVGLPGSRAIHADSSLFKGWASDYNLIRGWQNMADTSLGKANVGEEWSITGKAGNGVISLGDGGSITLGFDYPIRNGSGADFAVFENGFAVNDSIAFLEFAFVEVSTNGTRYVRFPSQYLGPNTQIDAFTGTNARFYNNLAGKYIFKFGTPFNLDDVKDSSGVDVNEINFVRIIDVKGSIDAQWGSKDASGNYINDPWPTPFPSAGFDFDAVGVINQQDGTGVNELANTRYQIYPNPLRIDEALQMQYPKGKSDLVLWVCNAEGKRIGILSENFKFSLPGIYYIGSDENPELPVKKLIVTP